jgi:predicted DNA-binding ribbon-helix-helix protein
VTDRLRLGETNDKRQMSEDKTTASFRVEADVWRRFKALAEGERLNATRVLVDYMDKSLQMGRSMYDLRVEEIEWLKENRIPSKRDAYEAVGKHVKADSAPDGKTIIASIDTSSAVSELDTLNREMDEAIDRRINEVLERQRKEMAEVIEGLKKPLPAAA